MRAALLVLLVLFVLPLHAGDPSPLDKVVAMFRDNDPGVRAAGTRLGDKELRSLLAPLLAAMKDDDPEVRRRARGVILGLVPNHGRQEQTAQQRALAQIAAQRLALQGFKIQLQGPRVRLQPVVPAPGIQKQALEALQAVIAEKAAARQLKAMQAIHRFGITGRFTQVLNVARGFGVGAVTKGSDADAAGLLAGDTILAINGKDFRNHVAFLDALDARKGFAVLNLRVHRGGRIVELQVK